MNTSDKLGIVKDFSAKRDSYYQRNYVAKTRSNYIRRLRRQLILDSVLDRAPGAHILDAGCGPALLYPELLQQCASYTALDLVPANLEEVTRSFADPRLQTLLADLDSFDPKDRRFDIVLCSGSLEYTSNPLPVTRKLVGCCVPGGRFVASFPHASSPYRLWSKYAYTPLTTLPARLQGRLAAYKRHLFRPAPLVRAVSDLSRDVRIVYFGYKLFPQPLDKLLLPLDFFVLSKLGSTAPRPLHPLASEFLQIAQRA